MGLSVQFQNVADVLQAYVNRNVSAWAIFCGKQFQFKYDGDDISQGAAELQEILEMFVRNKTSATYTLCVYEDLGKDGKIKSNTPYDGSFNFKLADHFGNVNVPGDYKQLGQARYENEIEILKKEIEELKAEKEESSSLGMIGEILNHEAIAPVVPMLVETVITKLMKFLERPATNAKPDQLVGSDSTVNVPGQTVGKLSRISGVIVPMENERIREALELLNSCTDNLPAVLDQLAKLATKKPVVYKTYVMMLMKMKI